MHTTTVPTPASLRRTALSYGTRTEYVSTALPPVHAVAAALREAGVR